MARNKFPSKEPPLSKSFMKWASPIIKMAIAVQGDPQIAIEHRLHFASLVERALAYADLEDENGIAATMRTMLDFLVEIKVTEE